MIRAPKEYGVEKATHVRNPLILIPNNVLNGSDLIVVRSEFVLINNLFDFFV